MNTSRTHIIKRDNGWAVKRQGTSRASKLYPTQKAAIRGAKNLTKSTEIVIHNRDGSIRDWINKKK